MDGDFKPNPALYVAGAGAALTILGSFLPWASVATIYGTMSVSGIDRDGMFTLVFGILMMLGVLLTLKKPGARAWGAGVLAVLTFFVGAIDLYDVSVRVSEFSSDLALGSVGIGLYMVIIGGALGLAAFGRNTPTPKRSRTKVCPQCAETVKAAARICRYCGFEFQAGPAARQEKASPALASPASASGTGAPVCPMHGIEMQVRVAVEGPHKGKRFYLCPKYKECRQWIQIDS